MATGHTRQPQRADAAAPSSSAPATPKKPAERPKYQLLEVSYIGDTIYEPERQPMIPDPDNPGEEIRKPIIITYDGEPGAHMKPVNQAALEMYRKHPPRDMDPISKLTLIGPGAEVIAPSRGTA